MRYQPSRKLFTRKATRERPFCRDTIRARFGRELGTFLGTFSRASEHVGHLHVAVRHAVSHLVHPQRRETLWHFHVIGRAMAFTNT